MLAGLITQFAGIDLRKEVNSLLSHQNGPSRKDFLQAGLASLSAQIGVSPDEIAASLLNEEGYRISEISSHTALVTLDEIATLSLPLLTNQSPMALLPNDLNKDYQGKIVPLFGPTVCTDYKRAVRARGVLHSVRVLWNRLAVLHVDMRELSKDVLEIQPRVIKKILRNPNYFDHPILVASYSPTTGFFRPNDIETVDMLSKLFCGPDGWLIQILDAANEQDRQWQKKWKTASTLAEVSAVMREGLADYLKKDVLASDKTALRTSIGERVAEENGGLFKTFRDQVDQGTSTIEALIDLIRSWEN